MKRLMFTLLLMVATVLPSFSMSYEEARRQAWFLTDKMAYELNLTPEQYDRAYQINLDYLMSIRTASDCDGYYWRYRDADFRCVLFDWQYSLYATLDYFFRPVRWVRSAWYYPVSDRYRWGYYYFDRPAVYVSYRGGMWNRRGHESRSPYYAFRPTPGQGMRNHYQAGWRPDFGRPQAPRPDGHRPDGPRPGNDRPTTRPGNDRPSARPGHGSNRPSTRPGNDSPSARPDNGRPSTRPSQGGTFRPSQNQGNQRPQGGMSNGGNTTRPSRNHGTSAGQPSSNRPSMNRSTGSSSGSGSSVPAGRSNRTFGR